MVNAPSILELRKYRATHRVAFYLFGTISFLILSIAVFRFSFSHPYFFAFGIFGIISFFYIGLSYAIGFVGKDFDWGVINKLDLWNQPTESVDVFYCCCGEDTHVVRNALMHICEMAKTYSDQTKVWVLDDSKDGVHLADTMFIAEKFNNVFYLRRPDVGVWKKAGNLRHAFNKTSAKWIAIFDADFTPTDIYLDYMVGFAEKTKSDIVQSPQYFRVEDHQTWVGKGASYVQELFYRLIQVSRDHFGASICVGTNAIYRRAALALHGGTALVAYSEDVRTGFNVVNSGGKLSYFPMNLAAGLSPDNLQSFILQQHRWALGSISLFFSHEFWSSNLNWKQKACFLSGQVYYMVTGLSLIFQFFPAIALLTFAPDKMKWFNIAFSLPSFLFGTVFMALWSKAPWGLYAVMARQTSYHSHLFALWEYLTGKVTAWQPSGASVKSKLYDQTVVLLKLGYLINVGIIGFCFFRVLEGHSLLNFLPCLFFTSFDSLIKVKILRDE